MAAEDVNHEILMAVLHIMEAWVEDDTAAAGLGNGLLARRKEDREREGVVQEDRRGRCSRAERAHERLPKSDCGPAGPSPVPKGSSRRHRAALGKTPAAVERGQSHAEERDCGGGGSSGAC